MLRFLGRTILNGDRGDLEIEAQSSDSVEVFYVPSKSRIDLSIFAGASTSVPRKRLLHLDGARRRISVFPINTYPSARRPEDFLGAKYPQIERITLADQKYTRFHLDRLESLTEEDVLTMTDDLPSCFVKDYEYGLGLKKPYRFIVDAIEGLSDCTAIVVTNQHQTEICEESKTLYISTDDFEELRKSIDRTTALARSAAQSVNSANVHNLIATRIGKPLVSIGVGKSPLRKRITQWISQGEDSLSQDEQEELMGLFAINTRSIAKSRPARLDTLKNDIELVTLETLIERYEEMIGTGVREDGWQVFLNENPFVLSLAFGYPVIKVQNQASVGGRKLSGSGDKVTDFLVKNTLTNNCAIVEIKRPNTKLLNGRPFRDGVYVPSGDLVGAINQALDQKHQFEQQIAQIKENSRIHDITSYSVHCCLLIGTMPTSDDRKKSFELFRGNSKDVEIVTFDELLRKLKQLRDFLSSDEAETPF